MLTHLSLFSGIGGMDIAAEWAGFTTVGQCEIADYPTKILEEHWPDVPRWRDIRTLTKETFYERTGRRTVDAVSGGIPCQPFSVAGKQKGTEDDRYLWPEMLRVIHGLEPTWVVVENVPGILRIAGKTVCEDLERTGYSVAVFDFEAAAVGARHRRDRIMFVAHSHGAGLQTQGAEQQAAGAAGKSQDQRIATIDFKRKGRIARGSVKSGLGGMVDGVSNRLDENFKLFINHYWDFEPDTPRLTMRNDNRTERLKCLGNAIVPQQFYPIFMGIAQIEKEKVKRAKP